MSLQETLWGRYRQQEDQNARQQQERHQLGMQAAYGALNLKQVPTDDMNVTANKTVNGIGPLGVAGIATAAGIGPLLLAAWLLFHPQNPASATAPTLPDSYWDKVEYIKNPDGSEKIVGRVHYRSLKGVTQIQQSDGTWKNLN